MRQTQKSQRELNKEATRDAIVRAARKLFASRGYAETSLTEVVQLARVTTGAVYHHFGDKRDLFLAVAESIEMEVLQRIGEQAVQHQSTWEQLHAGSSAMLEICAEPEIRRIIFLDAPNVIGPAKWREVELHYGYGMLCDTLRRLTEDGEIHGVTVEVLAPMLLGALIEGANAVAAATDGRAALASARQTVFRFLESLRVR
jgi:AcrR family transcriptional regulator